MLDRMKIPTQNDIRKAMRKQRRAMPESAVLEKSTLISEYLFSMEYIKDAETVMTYVDMPGEVKTVQIIKKLLKMGKSVAVPLCVPHTSQLIASEILSVEELITGHFGILEPKKENIRPIEPYKLDIVLVPGVAFDIYGNRIGHGKGYYDRFLIKTSRSTLKIGLAFDYQVMDFNIPVDNHDIPMDLVITESGIRNNI
jgi:5-formyltetrahydrofolate cyclo-ligase